MPPFAFSKLFAALAMLPNGDVLVAETNSPPKPDDSKGIKGWIADKVMARAGAG